MLRQAILTFLLLIVPAAAGQPAPPVADFAFVQFTDLHLNPHLARSGPPGRFPIPPIERGGKVYVCSNRGRLSVLDGRDGRLLWTYQTTPGFYMMAPPAVGASGPDHARAVCYVAGMDGSVTAVRARHSPRSAP